MRRRFLASLAIAGLLTSGTMVAFADLSRGGCVLGNSIDELKAYEVCSSNHLKRKLNAPNTASSAPTPSPSASSKASPSTKRKLQNAGPKTNRINVPFTSAGVTSAGHVFAAGLNWSKPVGLVVYTDGSSDYGLADPDDRYLLDADGNAGLVKAMKDRNMLLVTLKAPGSECADGDGVCWYSPSGDVTVAQKIRWAYDFATRIKAQYAIDQTRIVVGGYSSGAQFTTEYFTPEYGETFGMDLGVAIAYGGPPKVIPKFTSAFKARVPMVWNTGTEDPSYTTTDAYGVKAGEKWYRDNGFTTKLQRVQGEDHSRPGQFAAVMAAAVDQHLPGPRDRSAE